MLSGQLEYSPMRSIRVVVVNFEGILPFHLSVPCAVFQSPTPDGHSPFRLRVCLGRRTALA